MIDSKLDSGEAESAKGKRLWTQRGILGAVCALVVGIYAYMAHSGFVVSTGLNAADNYYNLLVQGFRAGQLNLKVDVPPGLAQLADPYDPVAHAPYPLADMSYYKGKLYLYFGVMPALVLFWPYVALTGHYLLQRDAAVIFCLIGFLTSAGLLCALWRRYFAEVSIAAVAAGILALGLATGTPLLLAMCDVYEVSVSCAYAFTMLALAAIWKALHHSPQRARWLAAASLAYGLAVGARPSLLFGGAVLLVPVVQAWRERRKFWASLVAATGPIAIIGLGLMLYNWLRFDSPFEFGWRYQLAIKQQLTQQVFSLRYLWFNFRVYLLESARWSGRFPFVHPITMPAVPAGHRGIDDQTFGVLTNIPLVWLALAVPLAWRNRSPEAHSSLSTFLAAVGLLLGIVTVTLILFCAAASRFEMDFLPSLVLLAGIGIMSLERALAGQPLWGRPMRWVWSLLLAFSVAFSLLTSIERCAEAENNQGAALFQAGRLREAIGHFQQALRLKSDDHAEAHYNLGLALAQLGRPQDAVGEFQQALRIRFYNAQAHYNLGRALAQLGRQQDAIQCLEQALQIKPDFPEAHNSLGIALAQAGNLESAVGHYEQALRIQPDYAEAHYNLGVALVRLGRVQEAISHWEEAIRIKPDFVEARKNLARARAAP
jgi:tetratricopeptide (TPR) repeat protein